MVEVMKIMVTSFKMAHACTATLSPPTLQQATTDSRLHQILLDTHGQLWVSLFGGHCSFLLGPSVHKVLFVPSKSLFPQSCVSSGSSTVGLMVTSSKRAYAIPRSACHTQVCCTQSPCPRSSPLLTSMPQKTPKHSSVSVSVGSLGPGAHKVCLSPLNVSARFGVWF